MIRGADGNSSTTMTERGAQRSRRGHQNHPKNIGIRTSNVPTSEIIQALRDGRNLETLFQHPPQMPLRLPFAEIEEDDLGVELKKRNSSSSVLTDHNDRNKEAMIKSSESKKRKMRTAQSDVIRNTTRSSADGAENLAEEEEDDETVELSKLRCTSERMEVIAEREHRRQKKCADYPGLAFGRSIFSSDSMMKFNIIRNELQNIMNNQLRRVRSPLVSYNPAKIIWVFILISLRSSL